MKYSPYYGDPIAFCIVLYFDHYGLASNELVAIAYSSLLIVRCVMYFCFIRDIVIQVCDHLKIPFITVQKIKD